MLYDREGKEVAMKKVLSEKGRSMIEMLDVLAIIGVLSVGGIAGYSKAMEQYRINKAIDAIATIIANIRTLYASQGNYEGVSNVARIVAPDEKKVVYGAIDFTGKSYSFMPSGYIGSANNKNAFDTFYIAISSLSPKECVALATKDWGSSSSGILAIAVGEGKVSAGGHGTIDDFPKGLLQEEGSLSSASFHGYPVSSLYYAKPSKLPISPAKAAQNCVCAGEDQWGSDGCYFLMLLN